MNLKMARVVKGLRQNDLRKLTGIHQSRLSLLETGKASPTLAEREKLAHRVKAMGILDGTLNGSSAQKVHNLEAVSNA
jgi:transcriptional regulator with XRE-family HTH domain